MNFQMCKLVLEKARNQRSNCQHLLDHGKSKRVPEKKSISALLTMSNPLTVDHNKLENSERNGERVNF